MTQPTSMTRRGLLRLGAVGAATAGLVALAPGWRAQALVGATTPGAGPLPLGELVDVFGPDGSCTRLPSILGFALPVGWQDTQGVDEIRVTYDERLYTLGPDAGLMENENAPTIGHVPFHPVSSEPGTRTLSIPVGSTGLAAGGLAVVVGRLVVPAYPDDLVAHVAMPRVDVLAQGVALWSGTFGSAGQATLPWGLSIGVAWSPHEVGPGLRTWCPELCVITSAGPGPAPAGSGVRVTLDRRAHPDSDVVGALDLTGSSVPGTGAADAPDENRRVLSWVSTGPVAPGEIVQVGLSCSGHALGPGAALLDAPVVQAIAPAGARARRATGRDSATRDDDVLDLAARDAGRGV